MGSGFDSFFRSHIKAGDALEVWSHFEVRLQLFVLRQGARYGKHHARQILRSANLQSLQREMVIFDELVEFIENLGSALAFDLVAHGNAFQPKPGFDRPEQEKREQDDDSRE